MSTRKETIIVELGGDSKKLLKELNMSKQAANQWARDIAKEITTGSIPDAWKYYSRNVQDVLNKTDESAKKTSTTFKDVFSAMFGAGALKAVKKFATEAITSFKDVAKELGELNKEWDSAPWLKQQREKQLRSMSSSDVENIVVGNAQLANLGKGIDDYLAKAAGLYAFGIGTVKEKFAGQRDIMGNLPSWGTAASRAADSQKDIMAGIGAASASAELEKQAKEAKKKADEQIKATEAARLENFLAKASLASQLETLKLKSYLAKTDKERYEWDTKAYEKEKEIFEQQEQAREKEEKAVEKLKKDQDELNEKEQKRIRDFDKNIAKFNDGLRAEFMPTLDELANSGAYTKDARRLKFLAGDTKKALQYGYNDSYINANLSEVQSIRDRLNKAGVFKDPNQGVIDELKTLSQPIKDKGGLPVKVILAP